MNATDYRNTQPTPPRPPFAGRDRIEGLAYLALAVATVVAVGQFETVIARFIPRAPAFAVQVKSAPGALVNGTYALGKARTNQAAQTAANVPPAPATNGPAGRAIGGRGAS